MNRDPKKLEHPKSVYLIAIIVLLMVVFVLAGVVNHLAFSSRGPGLLIPLVKKFEKKESPVLLAAKAHQREEEHQRFHHIVDYPETPEELQQNCFICHSNLPHTKTKKIRAMLNMHSNYLACETCHLNITEGESVIYKWDSPIEKDPKGAFFGTSYDPESGELLYTHDNFSKIAPFYKKGEQLTSTLHMQNAPLAKEYMKIKNTLSPEQRDEMMKKFHVDIRPKGSECQTCHASKGLLDFKSLGFSEKRIVDLENLSIKGMITKYDEFYLPDLFKQSDTTNTSGQDGK